MMSSFLSGESNPHVLLVEQANASADHLGANNDCVKNYNYVNM